MIKIIEGQENPEAFKALVKEYTDMILEKDAEVAGTLKSQHLDEEFKQFSIKYGRPYGRMYLALVDGNPAGSVALTRNDDVYCEIKRLYVRPEYRGLHISTLLSNQILEDAKEIGYQYIRLDTFPFMEHAIKLYEKLGFEYIEKYNDNPASNAIFMQKKLYEI